jgi:hypothetical protein
MWHLECHCHHDLDLDPEGNIYTLDQNLSRRSDWLVGNLRKYGGDRPYIRDDILVISPEGEVLRRINILDAFQESEFAPYLTRIGDSIKGDVTHVNTIQYITSELASEQEFLEEGQVLISLREMDTVALLDMESEKVVWAMGGPWLRQHDSQFLPNGNLLVFDNLGYMSPHGHATRVLEMDPVTQEIVWSYHGSEEEILYSSFQGAVQRLDNGNTLISSYGQCKALEVDGQEVVWEFQHPECYDHDDGYWPIRVRDMIRYDRSEIGFL